MGGRGRLLTLNRWVVLINKVALDQLDGQTRLSNSTTTDDHQLVFSEKLARVSDRNAKGEQEQEQEQEQERRRRRQ